MFHSQSRVERAPRRRRAPLTRGERGSAAWRDRYRCPSFTHAPDVHLSAAPSAAAVPKTARYPSRIRSSSLPRVPLSRTLSCSPRYADARYIVGGSRRGGSSGRHSFVRHRAARIELPLLCFLRVARRALSATCARNSRVPVCLDLNRSRAQERRSESP